MTAHKQLTVALVAITCLQGCLLELERVPSLRLESPSCPPVSVVAEGREMNFYEAYLDIEGHESQLLVPNIDMPGDESVYVLGLRPSSTGVEVLISDSEYVRDIDLRVSPQCHITTLRPNNSFKPKPLRGSA